MAAWLACPLVVYTGWFASYPDEENAAGWWLAGLVMLSPSFLSWTTGALLGFAFGRSEIWK